MHASAECFDFNQRERLLVCPVRQMGSRAKALLARPGFSGKALAVLSAAIYLVSEEGEILWLSQEGLAMHRRSMLASFRAKSICVGQTFLVQGPFLRFPEGVTIDLDRAKEWKPVAVRPNDAKPLTAVYSCARGLVETILKLGNAKGLGRMIPLISAPAHGKTHATSDADPLLIGARNPILNLAMACFNFDMTEVTRKGRELVGLGPGLTPSGDDFLGGLLFAAHSLKTAYPQEFNWGAELVADLIDWASTQTHPISHAILRDHAFGHGPEPLHDVVTSLLKGHDLGRAMEGVKRLLGIGDSSGWDILAGLLTGMLLVEGKVSARPALAPFSQGRIEDKNGGEQ